MRRATIITVGVMALLFDVFPDLRAAPVVLSILPSHQSVALGSPVNVSLTISGLGNMSAPSLGTFDLDVGFDPFILSFASAGFGDPVLGDQLDPTGMGNTITFINPGFATVNLFNLSLASADELNTLQPDSFLLASLVFHTISSGASPLSLTVNALGDEEGALGSATLEGASAVVTASEIPEPGSGFLVATAVFAVSIYRRWQLACKSN